MIKILYAASNNKNALIQLDRFLLSMKNKSYLIKIAAYKQSSPQNIPIDWTLDCLLNIFNPENITTENDNFQIYYEQVKYFAPDLIISDLEYFTSYIANVLNTTLWQCSSSLLNYALSHKQKYNLGLNKQYAYLANKNPNHTQKIINIIENSNCNFVYSHFGDTISPPELKDNFEWIRPYHRVNKLSAVCQHNIVAAAINNNKNILSIIKKYPDSVMFSDCFEEQYNNVLMKDISNNEEYFCNLANCNLFVCEGQTSFLADAFYNKKYSIVSANFSDTESVINSIYSERFGLSQTIHDVNTKLTSFDNTIDYVYNKNIQYLDERISEL